MARALATFGTCIALALAALSLMAVSSARADAQPVEAERVLAAVDAHADEAAALADLIWDLAELGFQEHESARLLRDRLTAAGFEIETGVGGMPTAFVARYRRGRGGGVVGILAEYDALPGLSQDRTPERRPAPGRGASHACGHNLLGAGAVAAALAVKDWMDAAGVSGEIRVYGSPAEEGGSGKVYLVRAGLFDDVDVVLHWHPDDENSASPARNLANRSARFTFTGVAAHAAGAPERGRSALDGVEAMNFMINLMREHVSPSARIHYVITNGGAAPNVVPDRAEVYYYVREASVGALEELWARVETAARAAAMGTGSDVDVEVMHANYPLLANERLQRRLHANLMTVGGVAYDEADRAFAQSLRSSYGPDDGRLGEEAVVHGYMLRRNFGSTDVGDVSWVAPTGGVRTATWPSGTSAHSWQAAAASGSTVGVKGMMVAAKTLALTAAEIMVEPHLRETARAEFERRRGDFDYYPLLGDRAPPLDYRDTSTAD